MLTCISLMDHKMVLLRYAVWRDPRSDMSRSARDRFGIPGATNGGRFSGSKSHELRAWEQGVGAIYPGYWLSAD